MVRFLLYANEWDIEGIITSSSQYHWRGHKWAGDDWIEPYLDAYEEIYPNLVKHDPSYPTVEHLRERHVLGNVEAEGEMEKVTPGSELIVKVLLDDSDKRPVWLQAWGGTNTIARALKTIQEEHPERMEEVARKAIFYLIWEQDETYQSYIRPNWEALDPLVINSDQFFGIAYAWDKVMPPQERRYFDAAWMNTNILNNHGPLCSLYRAREDGSFRSEGDSPSFMHVIETGLRSREDPGWGGWGGRFVRVRRNTWLDPLVGDFTYPEGRWYDSSGQGRLLRKSADPETQALAYEYFRPMWRWAPAFQNDWAARADWSVAERFEAANHPPVVRVAGALDRNVEPGQQITLDARDATDPDGDSLAFRWWRYGEADTADQPVEIRDAESALATLVVPNCPGKSVHLVAEVTDKGSPPLTRYQRVVLTIK